MKNKDDKRAWPRYHIDVPIRAVVRCAGSSKVIHGRANNLSQGGMAAHLAVDLVVGEWIEVDLALPYCGQPLKMRAVVRNRSSYCYGIEFSDISASQRATIERACHSLNLLQ